MSERWFRALTAAKTPEQFEAVCAAMDKAAAIIGERLPAFAARFGPLAAAIAAGRYPGEPVMGTDSTLAGMIVRCPVTPHPDKAVWYILPDGTPFDGMTDWCGGIADTSALRGFMRPIPRDRGTILQLRVRQCRCGVLVLGYTDWCSDTCRLRVRAAAARERRALKRQGVTPEIVVCPHCGAAFQPRRKSGRYCRPACRLAAWRRNAKA